MAMEMVMEMDVLLPGLRAKPFTAWIGHIDIDLSECWQPDEE